MLPRGTRGLVHVSKRSSSANDEFGLVFQESTLRIPACSIMFLEILAAVVMISLVIVALSKAMRGSGHYPPGPRPYPLIGNLPQLSGTESYKAMTKLAEEYGDIYSLTFPGGQKAVVINTGELAREAFSKKGDDFSGRPYTFIGDAITRGTADIICADFTPTMVALRRIVHSAMKLYGHELKRLEGTICSEADDVAKRFHEHNGQPVDPKIDLTVAVMNVICSLVYGQRYDIHDPEFERIVDYNDKFIEIFASYNLVDQFPWLRFFPLRTVKLMNDARSTRDEIINRKYEEHKEKFRLENANNNFQIQDLTDALLKAAFDDAAKESKGLTPLTEDNIMMTMQDMFNAGMETSSTIMRWILLLMIHYPEVQDKIHKELDDVVGSGRLPCLKDRENLPYLEAVMLEAMRFISFVPLSLPHKATRNSTLGGYDISKGTLLITNLWAIHHNPQDWDKPDHFIPERFLDENNQLVKHGLKNFIPFGAGRRLCLGKSLAKCEVFLTLARIFHQFVFKRPPGAPLPSLEGRQGVVTHPKPYKMIIEERA